MAAARSASSTAATGLRGDAEALHCWLASNHCLPLCRTIQLCQCVVKASHYSGTAGQELCMQDSGNLAKYHCHEGTLRTGNPSVASPLTGV